MKIDFSSIFSPGCVSAIISGIFSIIVIWINNKHAEKQLKIQFDNERKKGLEDKRETLIIQDKSYIDKEIIKKTSEALELLPDLFEDMTEHSRILRAYYIKTSFSDNQDWLHLYHNLIEDYNSSKLAESSASIVKAKELLAYSSKDIRDDYNSLMNYIINFESNQCTLLFASITHQYKVVSKLKKEGIKLLTEEEFCKIENEITIKHGKIMERLNIELNDKVDSFKKLDL